MINTEPTRSSPPTVQVRWLVSSDLPQVLRIEQECTAEPWSQDEFLVHLQEHNCIGMVAEHDRKIVGYMIYELYPRSLDLLNFVVAPAWRRTTVGKQMMNHLTRKLGPRRNALTVTVRETNLPAQLFLRSHEFQCVSVIKDYYAETNEDAYWFRYRLHEESQIAQQSHGDLSSTQQALSSH